MSAKFSLLIFGGSFLLIFFLFRTPSGELRLDRKFTNTFKGIAMLLILYHHSGIYHADTFWYFFHSGWSFWGVSLFFFISGFGLSVSYDRNQYSYGNYFRRRLLALWPTIIICMILRGFTAPLFNSAFYLEKNPITLLGLHEWFILAITLWYVFFILIVKNSRSTEDTIFFVCIFSVIVWAALDMLFPDSSMAFQWMRFPFSFALGVIFAQNSDRIVQYFNARLFSTTIFSLVAVFLATHLQGQKNLVYPMMDLVSVPLGICMVLWIYRLGINSRFLLYVGENSLPLYLLQVPLIKYGLLINQWRNDVIGLIATWALIF